jgi:hypothetical protein
MLNYNKEGFYMKPIKVEDENPVLSEEEIIRMLRNHI